MKERENYPPGILSKLDETITIGLVDLL